MEGANSTTLIPSTKLKEGIGKPYYFRRGVGGKEGVGLTQVSAGPPTGLSEVWHG